MGSHNINKSTLEEELPVTLREQLKRDGLPENYLPSWEYVNANTSYSAYGLNINAKENFGKSLHEFLKSQGFGIGGNKKYVTEDVRTIQSIEYFIDSLNRSDWSETTIDAVKSAIRKANKIIEQIDAQYTLLDLGRYDTDSERTSKIQCALAIIESMCEDLDDGTVINYTFYLSQYYLRVENNYPITHNPINQALQEFSFQRPKTDPSPVSADQIEQLWTVLDNLTECPYGRYELAEWKTWMKILIVFILAVGPRSGEITSLDVQSQLHFGDDPHIVFSERKNLTADVDAVTVPIMTGESFLKLAVEYLAEINSGGALIPSSQSEGGCRTANTLNNWLGRLSEIANVRINDEYPTIQNFRQMWKTQYRKALHENMEYIKFITEEDKKEAPRIDKDDYIDNVANRKHVRSLGRNHFDQLLTIDTVPTAIQEELDKNAQLGQQTNIRNY